MSESTGFRREITETKPTEEKSTTVEVETPNVIEGEVDGAKPIDKDAPKKEMSQLDQWETENGKYGADFFGIKEIVKTFPLSVQFGAVDGYIKAEIQERGWEKTTENYQKILSEIEGEIRTSRLETYARLKRLSEYVAVMKKMSELKKKKESFRFE